MPDKKPDDALSGVDSARAAKERMRKMQKEIDAQWPEVMETSQILYQLRKRNHFAELIMHAMGPRL